MNTTVLSPEETRSLVLRALRRLPERRAKTSELALVTGLPTSVVRRAGLFLASRNMVVAHLVPGRGKGEWQFHAVQLDLFDDNPGLVGLWGRVKRWFGK